jgi:hypothetical protein
MRLLKLTSISVGLLIVMNTVLWLASKPNPALSQDPTPSIAANPIIFERLGEIMLGGTSWQQAKIIFDDANYIIRSEVSQDPSMMLHNVLIRNAANDIGDPNLPEMSLDVGVRSNIVIYMRLNIGKNADQGDLSQLWPNTDVARYVDLYGPPDIIYTGGGAISTGQISFGARLIWREAKIEISYGGFLQRQDDRGDALRFCLNTTRITDTDITLYADEAMIEDITLAEANFELSRLDDINSYAELAQVLKQEGCFFWYVWNIPSVSINYTPTLMAWATDTPTPTPTLVPTNTPTATFTPTPTATNTSTPTATFTPSPTPTLVIPPSFAKLKLTSMCSADPALTRRWRVRNSNAFPLPFTWEIYGNGQAGAGVAVANGDVFFESNTVNGANTLRLFVGGKIQEVKASGGARCP